MKQYNRKLLKKKVYIVAMLILSAVIILTLPMWTITHIEVQDNNWYTDEEIIKISMADNNHILNTMPKEVKKQLQRLPYIRDVSVKYVFPGKMIIRVSEREPLGYVPFMGTYLCLDEQGQVIEQTHKDNVALPIIKGVRFSKFKIGEYLPVENEDTLLTGLEIIRILKKHKFENKVKKIDVYNVEQIHLYVDNLDVIIGNIGDFDKKLQWLIEAQDVYDMGVLDLSNIKNGQAILSPIT